MAELEAEEIGSALGKRVRRLQLRRIQKPVLAWIVACWALTLAVLLVLIWPGALAQVTGTPVAAAGGLTGFDAPWWFRLIASIAGGLTVGSLVVVHRTQRPRAADLPRRAWAAEALIVAGLLVPVLILLADHAWALAVVAIVSAVLAQLLGHRPGLRIIPGLLAAGGWLALAAHVLTPAGRDATSWSWIVLPALGAAIAAFGAYYGVARAAESRTKYLRVLFREDWGTVAVVLIVLAAAAIVVLRLTVLRELFPQPDPVLWSPWMKHWVSWLLAGIVVTVLVTVSIRSTRHPLLRIGQRRVTLGLALLGNLHLFVGGFVILVALVAAIVGTTHAPRELAMLVPWLKVAGVALLGLLMLLPALKGTAARWLGIVAALFLVPNTLAAALRTVPGIELADWAPSPVQVLVLLMLVSVVLALLGLVRVRGRGRGPSGVPQSLLLRFAVVPIVAVHAGWLLPVIWSQVGLVLSVIVLVVSTILLQPRPARDNATHSARSLSSAATRVFGLTIGMLAAPSLLDDPQIVVLGLIWLSVVVIAALCIETVAREPRAEAPTVAPSEGAPHAIHHDR